MRRRASAGTFYREELMNPATTSVEDPLDSVRVKGGRPVETTDAAKKYCENAMLATTNEVAGLYERAKK